ncbi:MAG TPA: MaoC family dehydratase [Solirubrobacteraceae bacterium]|nr:MaoC family dehydratase [Solirubrobacteraceae bacterium]
MESLATPGTRTELARLPELVGATLGPTEWLQMTQEQVNEFANTTGDHNFLHVDPERAKATPFGGTIAHGFLSLSLLAPVTQLLEVTDAGASVNYGLDRVRFPAPLPVGARWRGSAEITEVNEVKGGFEAKMSARIEVEGSEKPAVVAESLVRFYA